MMPTLTAKSFEQDQVAAAVSRHDLVAEDLILPFGDGTEFLCELFKALYEPGRRVVAVGHLSFDVKMAVDRAELPLTEEIGTSPFDIAPDRAAAAIGSPRDVVYLSNPNRVTGAMLSFSHLTTLAKMVPLGMLVVDEFLYGFNGVTALPLLQTFRNLLIMRDFSALGGAATAEAGYAVADCLTIERIRNSIRLPKLRSAISDRVLQALSDGGPSVERRRQLQRESLRMAHLLSRTGVQHRMTTVDFLLLRVAQPREVANRLRRWRVSVENLDRYLGLENYLRYRIQSPAANDRLLEAFETIPRELYHLDSVDYRQHVLRRGGEKAPKAARQAAGRLPRE